jgi:transcriptional regulator with XRE-family HTH domain
VVFGVSAFMTPGQTLRMRRIEEGLTVVALAAEVGVDESVVRAWEADEHRPRPAHAKRCADVLGVGVFDIWPPEAWDPSNGRK